jgi:predicted acylesterase/phospholipase RssA
MSPPDPKAELAQERAEFRTRMEKAGAHGVWEKFNGRIAVALSGGGARGAYEAGVLLAFQDARVPTHILTATSVGSINAAGYAAHSDTLVGNAEPVIEAWLGTTPTALGIEWTRYAWVLGGLIAASAGFGNLLGEALTRRGVSLNLPRPLITWFSLGIAGIMVMLFYDRMSYVGFVCQRCLQRNSWSIDKKKAAVSLLANVVVWGFLTGVLYSVHFVSRFLALLDNYPVRAAALGGALVVVISTQRWWRLALSNVLHHVLRLPLRPGLFPNFERGNFLRQRFSPDQLRASPMRVIFTVTDLESGTPHFFSNTPPALLAADPGADGEFVNGYITLAEDPISAVVASSALPLAFEPMRIGGHLYSDGGLTANQPMRPAMRLGADVVFLVMMDALSNRRTRLDTFLDVGLSALDILMRQNLQNDLRISANLNAACERAAEQLGVSPEEIEISLGKRRYRYVKAISICPPESLPGAALDFSAKMMQEAILQGYRDACAQLASFLAYAREAKFRYPRRLLDWSLH